MSAPLLVAMIALGCGDGLERRSVSPQPQPVPGVQPTLDPNKIQVIDNGSTPANRRRAQGSPTRCFNGPGRPIWPTVTRKCDKQPKTVASNSRFRATLRSHCFCIRGSKAFSRLVWSSELTRQLRHVCEAAFRPSSTWENPVRPTLTISPSKISALPK